MTRRLALLAVIVSGLGTLVAAQTRRDAPARATAPSGTASIAGVVVSAEAGHPLRRAVVSAVGTIAERYLTVTDDQGRFAFTSLSGGRYTVSVTRPGWVTTFYGARRPHRGPGTPVVVAAGEQQTDIRLAMARGAVITGTVRDASGRPAVGARVTLSEYRVVNGRRSLAASPAGIQQTDDRGVYRAFGLPPGEYIVGVSPSPVLGRVGARLTTDAEVAWARRPAAEAPVGPRPMPLELPAPTYYPSVNDPALAPAVAVAAGEERSGIDIAMQREGTARVEGVVRYPDGSPAPRVMIRTVSSAGLSILDRMMSATSTDAEGRFVAPSLRPGTYLFAAQTSSAGRPAPGAGGPPAANDLWLAETVQVSGRDIDGLSWTLSPGLTISGRVTVEGTGSAPPIDLTRVRLSLNTRSEEGMLRLGVAAQTPAADGTFAFAGVSPGTYTLVVTVPGGPDAPWMAQTATSRGVDLLDAFDLSPGQVHDDVVVTVSDVVTELSGQIQSADGAPVSGYSVVLFPVDRQYWVYPSRRMRPSRPGTDGEYRFRGMPPGEYFLALLTDTDEAELGDAGFLEELSAASIRVTLTSGSAARQDVKIR